MNKIEQLKQEIKDIEATIPPEASKIELYDRLAEAFFIAKDIIELYDDVNPIIEDTSDELQELKEAYNLVTTQVDILNKEADALTTILTNSTDTVRKHEVTIQGLSDKLTKIVEIAK